MIKAAWRRLWRSLRTWPDVAGWRWAAAVAVGTALAMAAIGFTGGLYRLTPPAPPASPLAWLIPLFAPALSEEALFRGLWIPDRRQTTRPWLALVVVTAIFTAWHIVEATTFLPKAAPIFLRADFLACAATLGLGCGLMRWRTGSLWPAVLLHWAVVIVWQTWLGGPALEALR